MLLCQLCIITSNFFNQMTLVLHLGHLGLLAQGNAILDLQDEPEHAMIRHCVLGTHQSLRCAILSHVKVRASYIYVP